jgi:hypothetical protein
VSGRRDPISFEIHSERKLPMASFLSVNTTGRNAMDWMEYFVDDERRTLIHKALRYPS